VLAELGPDGLQALEKLGVTNVFDLRGPREIAKDGKDRVPESVTVTVAPFHPEGADTPVHEILETAPKTHADRARAYYAAIPVLAPAQRAVAAVLRTVADESGSVLVHCAAGKDRTGWAIATLLTVAGADRDAVLADYLVSNTAIESLRAWMQLQYGDGVVDDDIVLGVDPSFLQAAWDSAERNFGSFDRYLDAIGVDEAVLERVRRRLVG
jgi:protein-tyrosine phosphatase